MDCEAEETTKSLKKTKLAQALLKEKPKFDPSNYYIIDNLHNFCFIIIISF